MANKVLLNVQGRDETLELNVKKVFNAGYAGSDQAKVQEHIDELAKLGVPTPSTTPTLYPISNNLLTTGEKIQVQHGETSGEIEYVLIWTRGELYITIGSDHTDRKLESYSVPMSKQAYPNIIANDVWRFDDIKNHWDQIELTCYVTANNERVLYQKGTLADLMSPDDWQGVFEKKQVDTDGNFFFSATINTVAKNLAFATNYEFELNDPVLNRSIHHHYMVEQLPKPIE